MKVLEFAFVGYAVTDLQRARDFYENTLGFAPASTWIDGDTGWIEYEFGPHTLAINNGDLEKWKPSQDGAGVALEVEDLDATIAELKSKGVTFVMEKTESPVCFMALIADPDGNRVCLHKRKG